MMHLCVVASEFAVDGFKIKAATGNFAYQPATTVFTRLLELCVSEFLFAFAMTNKCHSFVTFESRDFLVCGNTPETGRSNVFSPDTLQFFCNFGWNQNAG